MYKELSERISQNQKIMWPMGLAFFAKVHQNRQLLFSINEWKWSASKRKSKRSGRTARREESANRLFLILPRQVKKRLQVGAHH